MDSNDIFTSKNVVYLLYSLFVYFPLTGMAWSPIKPGVLEPIYPRILAWPAGSNPAIERNETISWTF